jgi:hypothetical protein
MSQTVFRNGSDPVHTANGDRGNKNLQQTGREDSGNI